MKTIAIILLATAMTTMARAQSINWQTINFDRPNAVRVGGGYDYGAVYQVGYSRAFDLIRPTILEFDAYVPTGTDLLDDFKLRLGAQVRALEYHGFAATARVASLFRRFENSLIRSVSFGSDLAAVAGYYQSWWYAAGVFGFDKAISTHIHQTDFGREYFPPITQGWYVPTGGHFYYGAEAGMTIADYVDVTARAGKTTAQFSDEDAVVPYYVQLEVGTRF